MSETYIPAAMRREVRERAHSCCEYCLLAEDDAYFPHEADHTQTEDFVLEWELHLSIPGRGRVYL